MAPRQPSLCDLWLQRPRRRLTMGPVEWCLSVGSSGDWDSVRRGDGVFEEEDAEDLGVWAARGKDSSCLLKDVRETWKHGEKGSYLVWLGEDCGD